MNYTTIGIDLAQSIFAVVILNQAGKVMKRKLIQRAQLLDFIARYEGVVAMEACGGAHHWARTLGKMGREVILLPPQHVKAYLRGQKNDYNDAQAIAEACQHGRIRPVTVKSVQQQDQQSLHRVREQVQKDRHGLYCHIRGLLSEYGLIIPRGTAALRRQLPCLLEEANNGLSDPMRALLHRQYGRLLALEEELAWHDQQLKEAVKQDACCQRLLEVPGIGPVVSSVLCSWMGDGQQFSRGRDAAAALGLIPKQHSSGGKQVLLGITKRGNGQVRAQVVHGARSVVSRIGDKQDSLSGWIRGLIERRGFNKAVIALANKLVRMAWVIICRGETYRPRFT